MLKNEKKEKRKIVMHMKLYGIDTIKAIEDKIYF
jgi:hypothetical protein